MCYELFLLFTHYYTFPLLKIKYGYDFRKITKKVSKLRAAIERGKNNKEEELKNLVDPINASLGVRIEDLLDMMKDIRREVYLDFIFSSHPKSPEEQKQLLEKAKQFVFPFALLCS